MDNRKLYIKEVKEYVVSKYFNLFPIGILGCEISKELNDRGINIKGKYDAILTSLNNTYFKLIKEKPRK